MVLLVPHKAQNIMADETEVTFADRTVVSSIENVPNSKTSDSYIPSQ